MKLIAYASVLLCLIAAGGCAKGVKISTWQQGVERYVREQGGGDPASLRLVTWKGTRRGFSVFENDVPKKSHDVNGVMLASRRVGETLWIFYLVGRVDKEHVQEIRPVALSFTGGKFHWTVGPADAHAFRTYRKFNDSLWHDRFPDRKEAPIDYLGFPRDEDEFDFQWNDGHVVTTHVASGARWELPLPTHQPAAQTNSAAMR